MSHNLRSEPCGNIFWDVCRVVILCHCEASPSAGEARTAGAEISQEALPVSSVSPLGLLIAPHSVVLGSFLGTAFFFSPSSAAARADHSPVVRGRNGYHGAAIGK